MSQRRSETNVMDLDWVLLGLHEPLNCVGIPNHNTTKFKEDQL